MTERNLAMIEVTPELIAETIKAQTDDIPDDATMVELWAPQSGSERRIHTAIFESDEFEVVDEGARLPYAHELDE